MGRWGPRQRQEAAGRACSLALAKSLGSSRILGQPCSGPGSTMGGSVGHGPPEGAGVPCLMAQSAWGNGEPIREHTKGRGCSLLGRGGGRWGTEVGLTKAIIQG